MKGDYQSNRVSEWWLSDLIVTYRWPPVIASRVLHNHSRKASHPSFLELCRELLSWTPAALGLCGWTKVRLMEEKQEEMKLHAPLGCPAFALIPRSVVSVSMCLCLWTQAPHILLPFKNGQGKWSEDWEATVSWGRGMSPSVAVRPTTKKTLMPLDNGHWDTFFPLKVILLAATNGRSLNLAHWTIKWL